jgi:eukaryotic-like serine/threonine-protein kinase
MTRMNDQIGRVLAGRYRLLAPIGAGASAQVYLAEDTRLRRRVAIKLLHESYADDDAFIRRFHTEAQLSAGLNHPNLLAVYDWGDEEVPFLVTEFIGGGSLRAMLDRGRRLTIAQATLIGLEAAKGLDHAHRQGLVHRDLKPANLLFGDDGRLRIADFGLARALADAAVTEPAGAVLGTARYASPEQAQGRALGGRSDVYSLALVLVEAVTGEVPFSVDTTIGTLMARVSEPIPVGEELGPLRPALRAAGAVDPEDRPDAARLATLLLRATEALDPPDPLPLAGAITLPDVDIDLDRDPTMLPEPSPTLVDEPEDPGLLQVPDPAPGRRARRRHRREAKRAAREGTSRTRRILVPVLVVLGLVAGGAGAYAAYVFSRPEHDVPDLDGQTVLDAQQLLETENLDVQLVGRRPGGAPGTILDQDPAPGETLREGQTVTVVVSRGQELVDVPERLLDLTAADPIMQQQAADLLTEAGLTVGFVSEKYNEQAVAGTVQSVPMPFERVPLGSAVDLVVSKGPRPRTIPADAVGRPFDEVAAELEGQSLVVDRVEEPTLDQPEGTVLSVSPEPGATVPRDSTVTVVVAIAQIEVPDVGGQGIQSAFDELEAAGLDVDGVQGPPVGTVQGTDPPAGTLVDPGSSVTLITSGGGGNRGDD